MIGRLLSSWEGSFSGAMLVSGRVLLSLSGFKLIQKSHPVPPPDKPTEACQLMVKLLGFWVPGGLGFLRVSQEMKGTVTYPP